MDTKSSVNYLPLLTGTTGGAWLSPKTSFEPAQEIRNKRHPRLASPWIRLLHRYQSILRALRKKKERPIELNKSRTVEGGFDWHTNMRQETARGPRSPVEQATENDKDFDSTSHISSNIPQRNPRFGGETTEAREQGFLTDESGRIPAPRQSKAGETGEGATAKMDEEFLRRRWVAAGVDAAPVGWWGGGAGSTAPARTEREKAAV